MKMVSKYFAVSLLSGVFLLPTGAVYADGCAPGQPCWDDAPKVQKRVPVRRENIPAPAPVRKKSPIEVAPTPMAKESGPLNLGIAGGVNLLYLNCEDTTVLPSLMVDYQPDADLPINLRLGVEGGKLDAEQGYYTPSSQFFMDKIDTTLIRVPLSVEYIHPVGEETKVFMGGGPSLLMIDGDADNSGIEVDDTDVGLHLGARVQQAISDNIAVSLEGGYMFAEMDAAGDDFDLNGAFTGLHLVGTLD